MGSTYFISITVYWISPQLWNAVLGSSEWRLKFGTKHAPAWITYEYPTMHYFFEFPGPSCNNIISMNHIRLLHYKTYIVCRNVWEVETSSCSIISLIGKVADRFNRFSSLDKLLKLTIFAIIIPATQDCTGRVLIVAILLPNFTKHLPICFSYDVDFVVSTTVVVNPLQDS